jgi:hypothetical protein
MNIDYLLFIMPAARVCIRFDFFLDKFHVVL